MEAIFGIIVFVVIFIAAFVTVIVRFVVKAVKGGKNYRETQAKAAESYSARSSSTASGNSTMTDEQRRRLDYLREQYRQRLAVEDEQEDEHEKHQADAHEHGHVGEEEHYEEIVGSLGEINDEGCVDLSGVRFIAHDLAYDDGEDGQHDYTELAKAIVVGEIVNSPRFKGLKRP